MPMDYDSRLHGPVLWPMPYAGCWLRQADAPDRETFWRLADGQLSATSYVRERTPEAFASFLDDKGRELVWLEVADPAASLRLFAINPDATMTALEQVRPRP